MSATPTPHDAVFRKFLTHPPTARDFLEIHLPAPLRQHCNLDTLQLVSGSFIEEDLSTFYSDILYSLETDSGDGYVYSLIEHQSSPDKHMTFRLMRYAIAAMQRHLDEGHNELPLVIPILFYHGRISPYPYSMNWLQSFGNPLLAEQIYCGHFPLVDVTIIPDEEIMTHRNMAMLELVQKHIRVRDLAELLDQLATLVLMGNNSDDQLICLSNYMFQTGETVTPDRLIRALTQNRPQLKEQIMTIAQQWLQEGIQQGIQQGLLEAHLNFARMMLAEKADVAAIIRMTGLTENQLNQLRNELKT